MKAIRIKPGTRAEIIEVDNTLEALQKEVDGYIETVTLSDGKSVIICDEEGRLKHKEYCCIFENIKFCGTILLLGTSGEDFTDVPDKWIPIVNFSDRARSDENG